METIKAICVFVCTLCCMLTCHHLDGQPISIWWPGLAIFQHHVCPPRRSLPATFTQSPHVIVCWSLLWPHCEVLNIPQICRAVRPVKLMVSHWKRRDPASFNLLCSLFHWVHTSVERHCPPASHLASFDSGHTSSNTHVHTDPANREAGTQR